MNARAGSRLAAAMYDKVQFTLIHGAMATSVKSVGGRLACRVTFAGTYACEIL
jgi:hypothetical protein